MKIKPKNQHINLLIIYKNTRNEINHILDFHRLDLTD